MIMKILHALTPVLLLIATSGLQAQTSDQLVAEGRAFLVSSNIALAKSRFAEAVALTPNHETANALLAFTRLAALVNEPAGSNFLNSLGLPNEGRNLYNWTALPPRDTNATLIVPSPYSASGLKAHVRTDILPAISAAAANLAKVQSPAFVLSLSRDETKITSVDIDTGDAALIRSFLHLCEFGGYTANGWDVDIQLSVLQFLHTNRDGSMESLLAAYPAIGTFESTSDFLAAKTAFQNAIDGYFTGSTLIRNRPTTEIRLFNFDPEVAEEEADFRQALTELKASLQSPVVLSYDTNYSVYALRLFENPAAPRSLMPQFSGNEIIAGTLPDATFGGVVDGVERQDIENALTGQDRSGMNARVVAKILAVRVGAGGSFELDCTGIDRQLYALETSTNLQIWQVLGTTTVTNGRLQFTGFQPPSAGARFLRVRDMSRLVSIEGKVLSIPTLTPVSGATILLRVREDNGLTNRTFGGVTDAQGNYGITTDIEWEYSEGSYQLTVSAPGLTSQVVNGYAAFHVKRDIYLAPAPANDNFANRSPLAGSVTSSFGWNVGATAEVGEEGSFGPGNSVWWSWVAPASGTVRITAQGPAFLPYIQVLSGGALNNLTYVATGDGEVHFTALNGTNYQLRITGDYDYSAFGASWQGGLFDLNLSYVSPPTNNHFANRVEIIGKSAYFRSSNLGATTEPGQPLNIAENSVWWSWTSPTESGVEIDVKGHDSQIDVFTGNSLPALSLVRSRWGTVRFAASAGVPYQFAVSSYSGGSFLFQLKPLPPPLNDHFGNRSLLVGTNHYVAASTFSASKELGEPNHGGNLGGHSAWWSWTASTVGNVAIETYSDDVDTLLAVYRGTTFANFIVVASDDDSGGNGDSRVVFAAQPGITYHIAVDGKNGSSGDFELTLNPSP